MVTQTPEPPPYGTPAEESPAQPLAIPQMPESLQYAASTGKTAGRTLDVVLSWVLYAIHVAASGVVVLISLFSIFLTDSCGSTDNDASVCDTDYFGSVLVGFWITVAALAIMVPIALIVAGVRRKPSWPWAVGGFGILVLATILFFALVTR